MRRAATFAGDSPLLSERESIFATHYLPSDGIDQTPRLLAAEGAHDVADLPQDLEQAMEVALPTSPPQSPISLKTLLSPTRPRSIHTVNDVGQKRLPNSSLTSSKWVEESRGNIHKVRRVASEGHSGKPLFQFRVTDQTYPTLAETSKAIVSAEKMSTADNDGEDQQRLIHKNGQTQPERGSTTREAFRQSDSKERSSSRGRIHVEKSIEATLPNRDRAKNGRTRKSSHLMGIFKETASPDAKSRDGQSRNARARHEEAGGNVIPHEESEISQLRSKFRAFKTSASSIAELPRRATSFDVPMQVEDPSLTDLPIYAEPGMAAVVSDTPDDTVLTPGSPLSAAHDPYFRRRDDIEQSMNGAPPVIPARLLEDIRKQHSLAPRGDRSSALYFRSSLGSIDVNRPEVPTNTRDVPKGVAEDRDDDVVEHISSAVYFPHPGPSDDDIEQFTSPDEDQKVEPSAALSTSAISTPKVELKRTLSGIVPPEHIDISVKSQHERRVFHGDYQPAEESTDDDAQRETPTFHHDPTLESGSSASESEISSGEELSDLGQAEDDELTPTSTPVPQSLLQRRRRASKATAPRGAVVLEPYSHQVGGHSTMFRFSRRAVCKQLNNRENEFYERIEKRHPDMLRFLPRSVTDL